MWISLAAIAAVQLYFVRELLAALFLFTVLFVIVAAVALVLYLVDLAGQRTIAWAEPQTKHAVGQASGLLHRAWNTAEFNTKNVSKKLLHRLHSQTVR